MASSKKIVQFQASNFFILFLSALSLIGLFWLVCIALTHIGLPFPKLPLDKFLDLGFFAISIFGIVVFLTIIPFQTIEGQLSPIFYARLFHAPSAHFGLYLLMLSSITCFTVIALQEIWELEKYLSQLFIAIVAAIIFAILFHRLWTLRCLYQPYVVYSHIQTLKGNEANTEIWLELFECTFKAIKQGRISDANNFLSLMADIYGKCSQQERKGILKEDLMSLHAIAQETPPVTRFIEEKWPFSRPAQK